jgi:hypothetical protein
MKRLSICLIAAVAMLALAVMPAMACNQPNGHKPFKAEGTIDFWEVCEYYPYTIPSTDIVGPAAFFTKDSPQSVLIHFTGEMDFTARDKNNKVTWHRHSNGTAIVYPLPDGGTFGASMAAARSVSPMAVVQTEVGPQSMYLFTCYPVPAPDTIPDVTFYNGPFQIDELVKDMGNGFACYDPHNPSPVSLNECLMMTGTNWGEIDYAMYHVKFSGHKVYWWKTVIPELGKFCYQEKGGYNTCQ